MGLRSSSAESGSAGEPANAPHCSSALIFTRTPSDSACGSQVSRQYIVEKSVRTTCGSKSDTWVSSPGPTDMYKGVCKHMGSLALMSHVCCSICC